MGFQNKLYIVTLVVLQIKNQILKKEYKHNITKKNPSSIVLGADGMCDACKVHQKRKKLTGIKREKLLKKNYVTNIEKKNV